MKFIIRLSALLAMSAIGIVASAQTLQLMPLSTFGVNGDGSILPGERTYLTGDGSRYQRGMAYNPATGHLLIANRNPIGAETINIIDGATGADVGSLDLSGIVIGGSVSFAINLIGVADDGAIYVGNLTTSTTFPQFNLYRWESETAPQQLIYFGDPRNGNAESSNTRWGDTMAVRGAGTNTQVLIASRGVLAAILRPADESLSSFFATTLATDVPSGGLGFGIAFGAGNTFWGKSASATGEILRRLSFDLSAGAATTIQTYPLQSFAGRTGPITALPASNLLAGIEMISQPDIVRLYDISDITNAPVLLDRASYATNVANNIYSGALAFGSNTLYALNSDNGILAFTLVASNHGVAPAIILQPLGNTVPVGDNYPLAIGADGTLPISYQWLRGGTNVTDATNSTFLITNAQVASSGSYSVVASNSFGAITSSVATVNVKSLLFYDSFSYNPDGASITNQSTWFLTSAGTSDHAEAGNLDVPGLASSQGNRLTWATTSMSLRRPFAPAITGGSIYYSFALRVDDLGTLAVTGDTLGGFSSGTTTTFGTKLNLRTNAFGGYNLGTSRAGTSPIVWAANDFFPTNIVFVVGRYTFVPGSANDIADVWLNPSPSDFGKDDAPAPTLTTPTGTDNTSIDGFFTRASGQVPAKKTIDELRVGLTWAAVTPPAVSATVALSVQLSGRNVIVSWPVSGSDGFTLESLAGFSDPDGWQPVDETVVVQGANNTVTLQATGTRQFFRLRK